MTVLRSLCGWLVSAVGLLLVANGLLNVLLIGYTGSRVGSVGDLPFVIVQTLVTVAALAGGSRLRLLGRRLRQRSGNEVLRTAVDFILLLRSFELDRYRYVDESRISRVFALNPGWDGFRRLLLGPPLEAPLAAALGKFYPVLTVGRPGERLPALGAARLYFDASEWQSRVEELLGRARLVVLMAGASPGVLWELQAVERAHAVEKLVIYVASDPNNFDVSNERWRTFREALEATTSFTLGDVPDTLSTDVMILVGQRDSQHQIVVVRPPSFDAAVSSWSYTGPKLGQQFASEDQESELCTMARTVLALTASSDGARVQRG